MYETLYRENAALLRTVAHKYAGACRHDNAVTVDDLMQAGFIGLVRAEKSYRPDKGKSWPRWAAWYIAGAMGEALGYRHGRWLKPGTISLDEPIKEDDPEGMTRKEAIADDSLPGMEDNLFLSDLQRDVRAAINRLQRDQERTVIDMCDLGGNPYKTAAQALGVSTTRIGAIRGEALKHLRRDQRLIEATYHDIDLETPFYIKVGPSTFDRTQTSAVEHCVLWRLDQREKLQTRRQRNDQDISKLEGMTGNA